MPDRDRVDRALELLVLLDVVLKGFAAVGELVADDGVDVHLLGDGVADHRADEAALDLDLDAVAKLWSEKSNLFYPL